MMKLFTNALATLRELFTKDEEYNSDFETMENLNYQLHLEVF